MSRLERERRLRPMTAAALARIAGTEPAVIRKVERAEWRAWPALRRRLAEALGVPEAELFADLDEAFRAARRVLEARA